MKRIYLLFVCVLSVLIMTATQFSQKEAKRAAEQFLKQKTGKVASIKDAKVVPISKTHPSIACKAMAVNLGNNDGFVLVVGNDDSNEVIGYCDHGTFNEQQMPHNMRSWLESYVARASACDARAAGHYPTKIPIAPLLKCKWNQSSPYNDQCP